MTISGRETAKSIGDDREHRDDKGSVDLTGRDPKERNNAREDRDVVADGGGETKTRAQQKEDKPVDLAGRNPQEKPAAKETRDGDEESKEQGKNKSGAVVDGNSSSSREDSPPSGETSGQRRLHKDRGPGPDVPFKATDTSDLRALRDALNKKEGSAPPTAPAEAVREGSFERKREPSIQVEQPSREGRGRRDTSDEEENADQLHAWYRHPEKSRKQKRPNPEAFFAHRERNSQKIQYQSARELRHSRTRRKMAFRLMRRWTKISRRMVNPEALEAGKERYEEREDFVIVLRVLTKEEIQAYAIATQQIRGELSGSGLIGPAID